MMLYVYGVKEHLFKSIEDFNNILNFLQRLVSKQCGHKTTFYMILSLKFSK